MPTDCHPMFPARSAHTMFSPGMFEYEHASRNSSHVVAWSMRNDAR